MTFIDRPRNAPRLRLSVLSDSTTDGTKKDPRRDPGADASSRVAVDKTGNILIHRSDEPFALSSLTSPVFADLMVEPSGPFSSMRNLDDARAAPDSVYTLDSTCSSGRLSRFIPNQPEPSESSRPNVPTSRSHASFHHVTTRPGNVRPGSAAATPRSTSSAAYGVVGMKQTSFSLCMDESSSLSLSSSLSDSLLLAPLPEGVRTTHNTPLHTSSSTKAHREELYTKTLQASLVGSNTARVLSFGDTMNDSTMRNQSVVPSTRRRGAGSNAGSASGGASTNHRRRQQRIASLPNNADRMLDAPDLTHDPVTNIMAWSNGHGVNLLSIALTTTLYLWDPSTATPSELYSTPADESAMIESLAWYPGYAQIALGTSSGHISILDVERRKSLLDIPCFHTGIIAPRVTSLTFTGHVMAYGTSDGRIALFDTRAKRNLMTPFIAHDGGSRSTGFLTSSPSSSLGSDGATTSAISNLSFTATDPTLLASAGWSFKSDRDFSPAPAARRGVANAPTSTGECVHIWDMRMFSTAPGMGSVQPYVSIPCGFAKGLTWLPWKRNVLLIGTVRGELQVVHTAHGKTIATVDTGATVTRVLTNALYEEILTTHWNHQEGENIKLWSGCSMRPVANIGRSEPGYSILAAEISPDGETICTATTGMYDDDTLKFWRVFQADGPGVPDQKRASAKAKAPNRSKTSAAGSSRHALHENHAAAHHISCSKGRESLDSLGRTSLAPLDSINSTLR